MATKDISCSKPFISSLSLESWKKLAFRLGGRTVEQLELTIINCCAQVYRAGDEKMKGLIRTCMLLNARMNRSDAPLPSLSIEMWDMIVSFVNVNYAIKSEVILPVEIRSITQQKEEKYKESGGGNSRVAMSRS